MNTAGADRRARDWETVSCYQRAVVEMGLDRLRRYLQGLPRVEQIGFENL